MSTVMFGQSACCHIYCVAPLYLCAISEMFYWQIYDLSVIAASFAEINWFILRKFAENNAASME